MRLSVFSWVAKENIPFFPISVLPVSSVWVFLSKKLSSSLRIQTGSWHKLPRVSICPIGMGPSTKRLPPKPDASGKYQLSMLPTLLIWLQIGHPYHLFLRFNNLYNSSQNLGKHLLKYIILKRYWFIHLKCLPCHLSLCLKSSLKFYPSIGEEFSSLLWK